jgi:hypothetical protein
MATAASRRRWVVFVLTGIAGALVAWQRRRRMTAAAPTFGTTQELIAWLAGQAVEIARQQGVTGLDYSPTSIQKAEEALGKLYEERQRTKVTDGVQGLASAFGAYVGECIRRAEPGVRWERDHPKIGEKTYPLYWLGGEVFPMGWCYKRLTNGPEDNVWSKYSVLKATGGSVAR